MTMSLAEERRARLLQAMQHEDIDLLVIPGDPWRSDYLRYALDVTPMEGHAVACIDRHGAARVFVERPEEAERLTARFPALPVSWSTHAVTAALTWINAQHASARVAMVAPAVAGTGLARHFSDTIRATTRWFDRLMVEKTSAEAQAVARATELADAGYRVFCDAVRVGRREYEVIAEVEAWFRSQGCAENFVIMASGGVEVRGMHPPGDRRIAAGDLVTTELTPCLDGYYAQICRTLVVGEPTATQRAVHALYREAMEAGIDAVRPGATHGDIALAQNTVFRAQGLGDYVTAAYTRVRGHGVGLYVDGVHVLEDVQQILAPDMTLIVHPNTYHPDIGYMVLGDTVRVTASGCDVLTRTPRDLFSVAA